MVEDYHLSDDLAESSSKRDEFIADSTTAQEKKLSTDLSLFLSDPNITKSLADGSLDLISYSSIIESELSQLEADCISIYQDHSSSISALHSEIEACDVVLSSLQEMLLGFQADLGGLSNDIRTLQDQSHALETQLRNRKLTEKGLRLFLEKIVVSPKLANVICNNDVPVNEMYMELVNVLNKKYYCVMQQEVGYNLNKDQISSLAKTATNLESNNDKDSDRDTVGMLQGIDPAETVAGREMKTHIEKLRLRSIARTRDYFLSKIAELRKTKTNTRMIQINSLLKYSPLMHFLADAAPTIYNEVHDVYVESMSKTLHALFRTYHAQLIRLDSHIANRHDLIAVEESSLRENVFSTRVNLNKRGDTFSLGERVNVLDCVYNHEKPLIAHEHVSGTGEDKKFPYEMIFRSIMTHLMDSVTNEFVFTKKFFSSEIRTKSNSDATSGTSEVEINESRDRNTFDQIFARTLSLLLEQLENYLFNCYDCLALLLMIKVTHASRRIMHYDRKIRVLDNFFHRVTMLLWPRLKMVMDAQLRSVRNTNASRLGGIELHPHYISRRYAEFTCSISLILNKGNAVGGGGGAVSGGHKRQQLGGGKDRATSAAAARDRRLNSNAGTQVDIDAESRASSGSSIHGDNASTSSSHRGSAGDMLVNDLSLITEETICLLDRLADEHLLSKHRVIFLINNLDQILQVFQERRVQGRETTRFVDLLMKQRELFVEEELLQSYSKMIAFIQQTESHMSSRNTGGGKLDLNQTVVESLVRDFQMNWKRGIEQINHDVLTYFSNFRNGMEILKQVLTQLLLYYTRFQDIIRKAWRNKPPAFCKDLVNTTVILAEIKKYAQSI